MEQPLAPTKWEAELAPQLAWAILRKEKSLFLAKTKAQFLGCPAHCL
jgi:hypothetical protein